MKYSPFNLKIMKTYYAECTVTFMDNLEEDPWVGSRLYRESKTK